MGDIIREGSASRAADAEHALENENLAVVARNIRTLVGELAHLGHNLVLILGDTLSLAGESTIRRAWDQLADAGVVRPRDKGKDMWRQVMVKR